MGKEGNEKRTRLYHTKNVVVWTEMTTETRRITIETTNIFYDKEDNELGKGESASSDHNGIRHLLFRGGMERSHNGTGSQTTDPRDGTTDRFKTKQRRLQMMSLCPTTKRKWFCN